jgi:hypothetical protein
MTVFSNNTNTKWGFLRETREEAQKAGKDEDTGLHRPGLEDYLSVIFPDVPERSWIHDKAIEGSNRRIRPDYRCDSLRLIIEFDGVQHYQQPDTIRKDYENQAFYESLGYKVVRIPYFIQLTNDVIKQMFGVDVSEPMFDPTVPSMGKKGRNSPAYCCYAGLKRMADEFKKYPQQYKVNTEFLESQNDDYLTGVSLLKEFSNAN